MTTPGRTAAVAAIALTAVGARAYLVRHGAAFIPATSVVGHMDHSPRHGGLVLMNGDTHYEVVIEPDGRYRVYFSDAVRAPLAATTATSVSIAIIEAGRPSPPIPLEIDPTSAFWTIRGVAGVNADAIVRIAYTSDDKPYWIDVPLSAWTGAIASTGR